MISHHAILSKWRMLSWESGAGFTSHERKQKSDFTVKPNSWSYHEWQHRVHISLSHTENQQDNEMFCSWSRGYGFEPRLGWTWGQPQATEPSRTITVRQDLWKKYFIGWAISLAFGICGCILHHVRWHIRSDCMVNLTNSRKLPWISNLELTYSHSGFQSQAQLT